MKQKNKIHIILRYSLVIVITVVLFVGAILYNLWRTTVTDAVHWNDRVDKYMSDTTIVVPERGNIYASNGALLAGNLVMYTARLDFTVPFVQTPDSLRKYMPALCDSLAKMFPHKSAKKWEKDFEKNMARTRKTACYRIATKLDFRDIQRMKKFPGFSHRKARNFLYAEKRIVRSKPYGTMASRSIGRVAEIESRGWTVHGVSGLEKALDSLLYGVPGRANKIQTTRNIVSHETLPAKRGYDLKTTIDIEIQDIVEEELAKNCEQTQPEWATAILMEVETGEIKAISNLERSKTTGRYEEGTNHAFLRYEPGSVMKAVSMMVALEDGIVSNPNEVIQTGYSYAYAGGNPITDAHGAKSMTVSEVIERSSNIGMAKIILRKYERDPGEFYSRLKGMGFMDPMHVGIAGETIPRIDSLGRRNWHRIALSRMAYGYTTEIPPVSTLAFYNAIANDGKYVCPRLLKEIMVNGETDSVIPVKYIRERVCSEVNARKLQNMLYNVVWGEHGTGRFLRSDKVHISGKTGTCNILVNGRYVRGVNRTAFCGYFPSEKPKYTCMVLMSRANCGAGRSSGSVLKEVALKLYARGMLDNVSDFRKDYASDSKGVKTGIMYATPGNEGMRMQKENMKIRDVKVFKQPVAVQHGTVPSVIGYGLRDALAVLERAGLDVNFKGKGYVCEQSLAPGSELKKGATIELKLEI